MSVPGNEGRSAALRWAAAGAVALGLHAAILAVLVRTAAPDPFAAGGGDAIAVELDPVEGDTDKADAAEAAALADEATAASAPAADAAASQATPPNPPPDPAPHAPVPPSPPEQPPQSEAAPAVAMPPPPVEARPEPPGPQPPVPPPPPRPAPEPIPPPPEPPQPVAPPTPASQTSAAAAASEEAAPVQRRLSAAREAAWRGRLVPHLNRYRRFPPGLRGGTARIGFTIDGEGRVTAAAVVTSSGDTALDAAARDLVERASPFPAPPPGVVGRDLSFVVPVHYDARRP